MVVVAPEYDIPRDLHGYGEYPPDPRWPNGARIAVSFVLNYEEGAERTVLNGDAHSEPYLWEKGASGEYKEGGRHLSAESEYEYGSRAGGWRLLRLFKEFGWHWTTYAVAQAMQLNPSFAKACVREGHEIAAHGLRWLDIWDFSVEQEKEYIKQNVTILRELTGEMPVGAFYGRGSPNTRGLLPLVWEEVGAEMRWCSEAFNDDLPYWVDAPHESGLPDAEKKGLLIVPYAYDTNDAKFHMSSGFTGFDYEDYLKNTFDMLHREGGKMMNVPMHSRILGKPARAEALRRFMQYVAEKEGVWVATRGEIAEHFRKEFPYRPGQLC